MPRTSATHPTILPKPAPPPPPPPPPIAPPSPGVKTYTAPPGDNLAKIAQKVYGDAGLWPKIYAANKAVIGPNSNLIKMGQKLIIP